MEYITGRSFITHSRQIFSDWQMLKYDVLALFQSVWNKILKINFPDLFREKLGIAAFGAKYCSGSSET